MITLEVISFKMIPFQKYFFQFWNAKDPKNGPILIKIPCLLYSPTHQNLYRLPIIQPDLWDCSSQFSLQLKFEPSPPIFSESLNCNTIPNLFYPTTPLASLFKFLILRFLPEEMLSALPWQKSHSQPFPAEISVKLSKHHCSLLTNPLLNFSCSQSSPCTSILFLYFSFSKTKLEPSFRCDRGFQFSTHLTSYSFHSLHFQPQSSTGFSLFWKIIRKSTPNTSTFGQKTSKYPPLETSSPDNYSKTFRRCSSIGQKQISLYPPFESFQMNRQSADRREPNFSRNCQKHRDQPDCQCYSDFVPNSQLNAQICIAKGPYSFRYSSLYSSPQLKNAAELPTFSIFFEIAPTLASYECFQDDSLVRAHIFLLYQLARKMLLCLCRPLPYDFEMTPDHSIPQIRKFVISMTRTHCTNFLYAPHCGTGNPKWDCFHVAFKFALTLLVTYLERYRY